MKRYIARHILLAKLTALALLTFCFIQLPARAMQPEADPASVGATAINSGAAQSSHPDLYLNVWLTGLALGQTLRYTWANLNDPDPQKREFEPLRIQVKLFAANGSVIVQAEAPAVDAGKFQSFDFNRDQINSPGEAGTGRLQIRLEVTVQFERERRVNSADGFRRINPIAESFPASLELVDNSTGATSVEIHPTFSLCVGVGGRCALQ